MTRKVTTKPLRIHHIPAGPSRHSEAAPEIIVDIVGDLSVILAQLDSGELIMKTYIYANGQILARHTGNYDQPRYFYLHDRLGSVRQIIKLDDQTQTADVVRLYTYESFGEILETDGSFDNSFLFTGQYYDVEINQYHLRARYNQKLWMEM